MRSSYFTCMKGERAGLIRARLGELQNTTRKAYDVAWREPNRLFLENAPVEDVWLAEDRRYNLEKQLEQITFRLSMVTEPVCAFCGETWGLSMEIDDRFGVTRKQAIRAGCFWCCGWCYAHVLNGVS